MDFEFFDTIAGYVKEYNREKGMFTVRTTDDREFTVILTPNTFSSGPRNLGEPYLDYTDKIDKLLVKDQFLFTSGIYYPENDGYVFEGKVIIFPGKAPEKFRFEEPNWWINQCRSIADFFLRSQFGGKENINYSDYRTLLAVTGAKKGDFRQETDTISRLVYGFASAFLLTGEDHFLDAAEKGSAYLREHMRFYDVDENIIYWYHGIDVKEEQEHKIFASEFGDDYDAIPMYEQIYALAGLTQTYRINGDSVIMGDIKMTLDLFDRFFLDREKEGYFSHLDPITLDPRSASLGQNQARKNWNSIGDHAPAYLINLWLATGEKRYADLLKYTADCIVKYFPDYESSPFVNERFFEDWRYDHGWGWQQNRAVIGHNLKIAWNLMRINNLIPDERYVALAKKIAEVMPTVGMDRQRCGWYDMMERELGDGEQFHRLVWHDRKAWWQQEQGILAYQILYGILKDPQYLKFARESSAFYNSFFLDHEDGGIYFNVLNNGLPFLLGTERLKGSHSMSGYHSIELAYLATVYTNLLYTKRPLNLYFKPLVRGFPDNILRVQPDILPQGSVEISEAWIDEKPWKHFDAKDLTVSLPNLDYRIKIRVLLTPTS